VSRAGSLCIHMLKLTLIETQLAVPQDHATCIVVLSENLEKNVYKLQIDFEKRQDPGSW